MFPLCRGVEQLKSSSTSYDQNTLLHVAGARRDISNSHARAWYQLRSKQCVRFVLAWLTIIGRRY